jgi:SAM-dependent MidA family methyltransferase
MSYDPEARSKTPLALKLERDIRASGPLPVADYMRACLLDPEHGYYTTRQPIGSGGDFVTAPEISQVFGELIGLWCAVVWQQMGAPRPVDLVELGPGRGTLMADALRALNRVPEFLAAARVRLVEINPLLRELQSRALGTVNVPVFWHRHHAEAFGGAPAIVIGNEFLDALPVGQHVLTDTGWRQRVVMLDRDGRLVFETGPVRSCEGLFRRYPEAQVGEIAELAEPVKAISETLPFLPASAALLIDYGHTASAIGDTLQAVRAHRQENPLTSPGEADLTTQVDFARFAECARAAGLAVDGPVTQTEFLSTLGLAERASRLMAANPALAHRIEADAARLVSPTGMGSRFKAIGLRSPSLPPLPGFPGKA